MTSPSPTNRTLISLAAVVVVLAGLKAAQTLVVPFLLAVFIATIASTLIQWLNRQTLFRRFTIPQWISVLLVLSVLIMVIFGLGMVVLQVVKEFQGEQAFYETRVRELSTNFIQSLQEFGINVSEEDLLNIVDPSRVFQLAGQTLQSLGQILSNLFLIILTVIFILAEGAALPQKLQGMLAERNMKSTWLEQFGSNLNRYIAVKTSTSLLTGLSVTVVLMVVGVDFAILWGLLAFMLNFIPNIGSVIAATPVILITVVQLGFGRAMLVLVSYVVINVAVGAGIEPRFLGRTLGLSTLVVFLSLIFWGWMFGPVGMILSVPLTITAKIAFESHPSTAWISHLLEPGRGVPPTQPHSQV